MAIVENYTLLDALGNYDRQNNPLRLSMEQLLPLGFSWTSGGKNYRVDSAQGVVSTLLKGDVGIALIMSPYNKIYNKAAILSPDAGIMWDVSYIAAKMIGDGIFSDVYYVLNELCFFINCNGQDFRFSFDILTGKTGRMIPSY
jgi:hypothetical protein